MGNSISILVAVRESLLADGIVNAIQAADDLELIANPKDRAETMGLVRSLESCRISVAIIDYDLFGRDVFEAIKEIRLTCPDIDVLALVNTTTPACLRRSLDVGVAGYILNTANCFDLINAIRAVCSGKTVVGLQTIGEILQYIDCTIKGQGDLSREQLLGRKELEVLMLASKALTNREIAQTLFISERTVQSHFSSIFMKLRVSSRTEAVLKAWRDGLIRNGDFLA